jgi:SHS2 domain-containing protein
MYELFDHTADLGLRIRAPNLPTVFADAARALFAAIIEDLETIQPQQTVEFTLPLEEPELLLFDWLRELLYRFDAQRLVCGKFEVALDDSGLKAHVHGEPFDPSRHIPLHEVKAITYHGLRLEKQPDGWLAEVIVDI